MKDRVLLRITCIWLLAAVATFSPCRADEPVAPGEFLGHYKSGVAPMLSAYEQVTIDGTMSDTQKRKESTREDASTLKYFHDGDRQKVIRTDASGAIELYVADPSLSFRAERPAGAAKYIIKDLSTRSSNKYDDVYRTVVAGHAQSFFAAYSYYNIPLIDLFSMKNVSIRKGESDAVGTRGQVRVWIEGGALSERLQKEGLTVTDGWFLFDPKQCWALQSYEVNLRNSAKIVMVTHNGSVEYGEPAKSVPVPRTVRITSFPPDRNWVREYKAEIRSVQFGPVADREFTLHGCGIDADVVPLGRPRSVALYWSLGVAALAIAVIVLLRRSRGGARGKGTQERVSNSGQ